MNNQLLSLSCGVYCPTSIASGSKITARVELYESSGEGMNTNHPNYESKICAVLFLSTEDEDNTEEKILAILPALSSVNDDSNSDGNAMDDDNSVNITSSSSSSSSSTTTTVDKTVAETIGDVIQQVIANS